MAVEIRQGNYEDAQFVRRTVFMEEQGFQNEFEAKDEDPRMIQVTAYDDGTLVGCARVFPATMEPGVEDADGRWVFGRLAVLPEARGSGLGSRILLQSEAFAKDHGATEIHLHAQCNAQPFYRKLGYEAYGPIEFDEHVEHQWMVKRL